MTSLTAPPHAHATHAEGLAIFNAVLGVLEQAGWTRHRVDTLTHPRAQIDGKQWMVQHHFDAGCWQFEFGPDPYWHRNDAHRPVRIAKIDRRRPPLPSCRAVVSQLLGQHLELAGPPISDNGEAT